MTVLNSSRSRKRHRRKEPGTRAASQRLGEPIREHGSVGETRQRILEGQAPELLFERLPFRDVDEEPVRQDVSGSSDSMTRASSRSQRTSPSARTIWYSCSIGVPVRCPGTSMASTRSHRPGMKQGQPQVLVGDERLGWIAGQRLDLRTEVDPLQERPVGPSIAVEVDGRRAGAGATSSAVARPRANARSPRARSRAAIAVARRLACWRTVTTMRPAITRRNRADLPASPSASRATPRVVTMVGRAERNSDAADGLTAPEPERDGGCSRAA